MADGIRRISLRRGFDPARLHPRRLRRCRAASTRVRLPSCLGIATVMVPPDASLLSAVGLGRRGDRALRRAPGARAPGRGRAGRRRRWLTELAAAVAAAVVAEGVAARGGGAASHRQPPLRRAGHQRWTWRWCGPRRPARVRCAPTASSTATCPRSVRWRSNRCASSPPRARPASAGGRRRRVGARAPVAAAASAAGSAAPGTTSRYSPARSLSPVTPPAGRRWSPRDTRRPFLPPGWSLKVDGARALVLRAAGEDGDG